MYGISRLYLYNINLKPNSELIIHNIIEWIDVSRCWGAHA